MSTYVLPQVRVFQQFSVSPAAAANPLRALVAGPHAALIRYDVEDERPNGRLGFYDRLVAQEYPWPDRPAGATVDPTYTKVRVKDALLKYFEDTIGQGSTITKLAGYSNRVRSATRSFAANGDDYPRHSSFLDRDVRKGDVVKVRGISGGDPVTLWTYVRDIHGDVVAAVVDSAAADASNASSQSASSSVEFLSGPENCVAPTSDHSAYSGLASGYINETYDVLVTEGSVNGDYTAARVRVISGSGTDDQTSVAVAAIGQPTSIGTRGLTVTFDTDPDAGCSASADQDEISPGDLIAGQKWRVTVAQAFSPAAATSGGSYDETRDTTYIVTVTRGGLYAGATKPTITVSTTNGIDQSGPTEVTAASTDVAVGTLGVTVEFSGTGLRKGDRYYIAVTGEAEGPMRVLELGHSLDSGIADGSEVDVTLFIRKPVLELAANREGSAPLTNWDHGETAITINDGAEAYDDTWTDGGVPQPLEIYSEESKQYGIVYVDVRYWLSDLASEVGTVFDVADLDSLIPGELHPDNPLKWGVSKALANANGTDVKFVAVAEPDDDDSWANVIELIGGRDDVYGMVPLTRRRSVLDLFAAHAEAQSGPEQCLWRVLWANLSGIPEIPVVATGSTVPNHTTASTSDGGPALATVSDNPDAAGSQYTILRLTSGNAEFDALGVRPGDFVRLLFTPDGFGNETYSSYKVDEVLSEDELRLVSGPDAPISVAARFEIWRTLTAVEEANEIALQAGSFGSARVRAVWPDQIESSGTVMEGYFLCCALAGLRSGVLPHQGLTNLEVGGFTSAKRTTDKFSKASLDAMALGGVWIVTQELAVSSAVTGRLYTRHAVTTGAYDDLNAREEAVTGNVDSISYRFRDYFRPYIGVTNVSPVVVQRIGSDAETLIQLLQSENNTTDLGPQLVSGTVAEVRPHVLFKDRVMVKLNITIPYPNNSVDVYLAL